MDPDDLAGCLVELMMVGGCLVVVQDDCFLLSQYSDLFHTRLRRIDRFLLIYNREGMLVPHLACSKWFNDVLF